MAVFRTSMDVDRSEEAGDLISGTLVMHVGVDVRVKFVDSRSNRSREIYDCLTL